MTTTYDFDLFVIGGGSGGVRAARISALAGARVGLAEEYRMGGTCVIRGCVPKKFMVYASQYGKAFKSAKGYGWSANHIQFHWPSFADAMNAEVDRLSGIYMRNLVNAGATVFEERAVLEGPHTIRLTSCGETVTAERILVATGGQPWRPDAEELPGVEHTITSNDVFHLPALPKHIVIAGGGYIAVEFAHIFAGLGVETCLVYRGETVLRGFDMDVRTAVHEGLKDAGVRVITHTIFESIEKTDNIDAPLRIALSNGTALDADVVCMAVGRRPNTPGLGCEDAGVALAPNGAIKVDEWSKTNVDGVWAVGDVTDRLQLTPVAIREGHAFADTEFNDKPRHFDHELVATAVFSQPEVGTVGLSEAEARSKYKGVDIYKSQFRPMKNMLSGDTTRMLMKLVVKADDQRVLGAHIVGPDAAEMIQMLGVAIKMGATKADLDATCAVHPTAAEEIVTMNTKWVPEAG
ncbi:MAG: glutathione-disulfide reductase [Pseudomonadota bacterium]